MNKTPEIRFPEFEGLWLDTKLGELMDFRNGMNADKSRYGRGYKFVNVLDVIAEAPILDKNIIGRVDADSDEVARFSLKSGDIVFQRSSETREDAGQANAYIGNGEALFGGFVIRGRPTVSFDVQYMAALLRTDNARKNTTNLAGGSTRFNVGQETLSSVQIQIAPTLLEQKKIAAFLSAVDDKLAAVEAQLAGWRDYKRGMMQALFSQTLRFKADDGGDFPDWVKVKLENKFSFHKTNSLSRAVLGLERDGIENIHYGDIHTKYRAQFDIRNEYTGIIPNHLADKAGEPLKKGDVIFADASEDYNDVGKAIEVINLDNRTVVAGLHTIVARPKKDTIALGFAAYLFASWLLRKQLMRIANGASVLGISKTNLAKVDLTLPSLPEQQKIADALSAIDAKIDALTGRLEATREFKRGLLQKMFV